LVGVLRNTSACIVIGSGSGATLRLVVLHHVDREWERDAREFERAVAASTAHATIASRTETRQLCTTADFVAGEGPRAGRLKEC
jgi:hypothetical protein